VVKYKSKGTHPLLVGIQDPGSAKGGLQARPLQAVRGDRRLPNDDLKEGSAKEQRAVPLGKIRMSAVKKRGSDKGCPYRLELKVMRREEPQIKPSPGSTVKGETAKEEKGAFERRCADFL